MKIHFEADLDYQRDAVDAVCDLFKGQEVCHTEFTVARQIGDGQLFSADTVAGVGNRLSLLDEQILANLQAVQLRNGLAPVSSLPAMDFTVEMETGTGKTYVYLRTIYELNRRFGFRKFVVVVPSRAIVEGVMKTLEMTKDHFRALYSGTQLESFRYDSGRLGQLRDFASSSKIQVMVTTIQSINSDTNIINMPREEVGGGIPMELVRATRPVVIVDEPQSVEGGESGKGREAILGMAPLCTVGYSATPNTPYPRTYKLDAVDAYERKLVKQIEVASGVVSGAGAPGYVKFLGIGADVMAPRLELDIHTSKGTQRKQKKLKLKAKKGAAVRPLDLEEITGGSEYEGMFVKEVRLEGRDPILTLTVPGAEEQVPAGASRGGVDVTALHTQQIRATIEEHLRKELRLNPEGIKVLSLFFVDHVADYRNPDGTPGRLADIFEEQYREVAGSPEFQNLLGGVASPDSVGDAHNGYFSQDKKGAYVDTTESNKAGREAAAAAYALIMRDKEQLLSLETPLRFIFSHSALREGWDNPNVFQICSLREMASEQQRRQTIGRGLRICVNQEGNRVHGFDVNTVTVVATESYEDFARNLQSEMEQEGMRFGVVEPHVFALLPRNPDDAVVTPIGVDGSREIWDHLVAGGMLTSEGMATSGLLTALADANLEVPPEYLAARADIMATITGLISREVKVRDARQRETIPLTSGAVESPEFLALWERIRHRSTYRVAFDADAVVSACADAVRSLPAVPATTIQWTKAHVTVQSGGVEASVIGVKAPVALPVGDIFLPDILTELQSRTQLTRRSLARILRESGRLEDFATNPQVFIDGCASAILDQKQKAIVDGITYVRSDVADAYSIELFSERELTGYTDNLVPGSAASLYEQVVCDSGIEKQFADDLQKSSAVVAYVKLPGWFTIPTPLGEYNPDWALVVNPSSATRVYFVVETKGTDLIQTLRIEEQKKIECGQAHFRALAEAGRASDPAEYEVATNLTDVLARAGK